MSKNTIWVAIQKLINLVLALWISRILLRAVGIDDFGLYGVVGSVVMLFNSLRSIFSSSIQRFINISKANQNPNQTSAIFSMGVMINATMAIIILLVLEVGGNLILPRLDILPEKMFTAQCVLQFSIMAAIISILTVPFDALIIANEKFKVLSFFSLIDYSLRLGSAYSLLLFSENRIVIYSILLVCCSIGVRVISSIYVKSKFRQESKFQWFWDKALIRKMIGFAGWNFCGNLGYSLVTEGQNVVLNIFGGVVVNAARSITYQISSAIKQFSSDLFLSVQPRSMVLYSNHEIKNYMSIQIFGAKVSFGLCLGLTLPIVVYSQSILKLWLGEVPAFTIEFLYAVTPYILLRSIHPFLDTTFKAAGRLKEYQLTELTLMAISLLLSWIFLKNGLELYSVFIIMGVTEGINLILILIIAGKKTEFESRLFCKALFLRLTALVIFAVLIIGIIYILPCRNSIIEELIKIGSFCIIYVCVFYHFVLSKNEKLQFRKLVQSFRKPFQLTKK